MLLKISEKNSFEDAKMNLESDLRKYIVVQMQNDEKDVSANASDAFTNKKSLNE